EGVIHCASRNPLSSHLQETLAVSLGARSHQWHFVKTQDLERLLKLVELDTGEAAANDIAHLRELAEEAPTIELVSNIMSQASDESASDVHIEPEENHLEVRYRIDGVLHARMSQPRSRFDAV